MNKEKIVKEAHEYYKGKNMRMRYTFIVFIIIIIALQFILPRRPQTEKPVETTNMQTTGNTINFLGEDFAVNNLEKSDINIIHQYQELLQKNGLPTDLAYVINYSQQQKINNILPDIYITNLVINDQIDQRLDSDMIANAYISYRKDLYKETKNRKLAVIASYIGIDKTRDIFVSQKNVSIDDMYFSNDIETMMAQCASQKRQLENGFDTIQEGYTTTEIREIKNIAQRSKEENISNKIFRQLNPRILTNELPKKDDGKRTIKLPK